MDKKQFNQLNKKLDDIEKVLRHLLVIELYENGLTQEEIGKHLKIAKGSVNKLLKGVKTRIVSSKKIKKS